MSSHPYLVDWRLNQPPGSRSMCEICPLKGQRKVGCDGDPASEVVIFAEGPAKREESYGLTFGYPYGRPLVGTSGYLLKTQQLTHPDVGLVEVEVRTNSKWPKVVVLRAFIANVTMCRSPNDNINTKEGRKAILCCANSARALVRRLLQDNPDRLVAALGATALGFMLARPKIAIDPHRGRPYLPGEWDWETALAPVPESVIMKAVLRGQKPTQEWWPSFQYVLKRILAHQVKGLRAARKRPPEEVVPHLEFLKALVKKQRDLFRKRAKQHGQV